MLVACLAKHSWHCIGAWMWWQRLTARSFELPVLVLNYRIQNCMTIPILCRRLSNSKVMLALKLMMTCSFHSLHSGIRANTASISAWQNPTLTAPYLMATSYSNWGTLYNSNLILLCVVPVNTVNTANTASIADWEDASLTSPCKIATSCYISSTLYNSNLAYTPMRSTSQWD